jgi:hypothetical protein
MAKPDPFVLLHKYAPTKSCCDTILPLSCPMDTFLSLALGMLGAADMSQGFTKRKKKTPCFSDSFDEPDTHCNEPHLLAQIRL